MAIQSRGFYDHVPVDRVLLVKVPQPDCDTADWWYPGATQIMPDLRQHTLDEQQVRGWMAGLDVVFSVETPYDWRLPNWAREMGVKTVIQGNPEFTRHMLPEYIHLGRPDAWWWPTTWRLGALPPGTLMPVPMPDSPMTGAAPGEKLRIFHTTGKRAFQDRNGTDVFLDALRAVYEPIHTAIYGLGKNLPQIPRLHPKQEVEVFEDGVEDQWEMYQNHHLLVMPRRFGGLCLERSTPVEFADGRRGPISAVRVGQSLRDIGGITIVTAVAERLVEETIHLKSRGPALVSSTDHRHMVSDTPLVDGLTQTPARDVKPGQWVFTARPGPEGITAVDLGPKPSRKGLRNWQERVELDAGWARIIGLWLAEGHGGWYERKGRARPVCELVWNFGERDGFLADELVDLLAERGIRATASDVQCGSATFGISRLRRVRCRSELLGRVFDALAVGLRAHASGKRAPDLHADLCPHLIGGWLDGDGNVNHGCIAGWSRSVEMIAQLWRLLAKTGVCASITHHGERLDVNRGEDVETVASWCRRLKVERVRTRSVSGDARVAEGGWMTKIKAVARVTQHSSVVAIETSTGTYLASDILTHNCLPALEAASRGIAVLMPDVSPNAELAQFLCPTRMYRMINVAAGPIPVADTEHMVLGEMIDSLSKNPEAVAQAQQRAWDTVPRWSEWRSRYIAEFEKVCNQ